MKILVFKVEIFDCLKRYLRGECFELIMVGEWGIKELF